MNSTTRTNGKVRASAQSIRAKVPEFGPIRNERTYARMNALMAAILKEVGDDEDHELADLLDIVSTLVAQYENTLAKELGTQSVVSEVLSGQRELNARQIRALAKRFGVSPAVFIGA